MRKRATCQVIVALVTLATGCVRTLHPLYTEQDVIFDPALVACWAEEGEEESWHFSRGEDKSYQLVYTDDKGKTGRFVAHLLKLDGQMFIDLFPTDPELSQSDFYAFHILPVHTFMYVRQIRPTLQMSFPDVDRLKALLAKDPAAIKHEKIEDEIILTAGTPEMQAFWIRHTGTNGLFGDLSDLRPVTHTANTPGPPLHPGHQE